MQKTKLDNVQINTGTFAKVYQRWHLDRHAIVLDGEIQIAQRLPRRILIIARNKSFVSNYNLVICNLVSIY